METLAWLGAYLVGFAILQLYLYRYFMSSSRGESSPEGAATGVPEGGSSADHEHVPPDGVDRQNLVRCGECGAYNRSDQMFVYCKACGDRLQ